MVAAVLCGLLAASPVQAQGNRGCTFLCPPELKIEPTFTVENLFRRPRIERLEDGRVVESGRAERETAFELIVALDVPTEIPRVGLTLEAIFVPLGGTAEHLFTDTSASEVGRSEIRENRVEVELELNIDLFDTEQTGGLVSSHVDIVDKFSPAEEPGAGSVFTHKLNFEWDTAFHVFSWLRDGNWLRNIEAEVSLDYVATGLPRAGDMVGAERFLDDASPWSLSFVFVFPLAPLVP